MRIILKDISKRYTTHWILKKINYEFESGLTYSVQGANGSGKSTLMQIISTQLSPTLGKITYLDNDDSEIESEQIPFHISFAAPYILPLENLSIKELFAFFTTFKEMRDGLSYKDFLSLLEYPYKENQLIKYFSSGMKQRLLLAFTILSKGDLILLDEPSSYLDEKGVKWYHSLLREWKQQSTVIISSNDKDDLVDCTAHIHLSE